MTYEGTKQLVEETSGNFGLNGFDLCILLTLIFAYFIGLKVCTVLYWYDPVPLPVLCVHTFSTCLSSQLYIFTDLDLYFVL